MTNVVNKEDLVLYILSQLPPEKSTLFTVNKIAFLVEFAYMYFTEQELSDADYAAIDHGPVINDYRDLFARMSHEGLIKQDAHKLRLIDSRDNFVPKEIDDFAAPLVEKYASMNFGELRALTHNMDSYLITTKNEKVMGNTIKKNLALLEDIFEEGDSGEEEVQEVDLPVSIDFGKLTKYEF